MMELETQIFFQKKLKKMNLKSIIHLFLDSKLIGNLKNFNHNH